MVGHAQNITGKKISQCLLPETGIWNSSLWRFLITSVLKIFNSAMTLFGLVIITMILLFHTTSVLSREVTLTWNANSEPTLGGYRLYYGPTSRNYTSSVDVGNQTIFTVFGLEDDRSYYFAVTAYDVTRRVESGFSNEVFLASTTPSPKNPSDEFYQSVRGPIRGWICGASTVEVKILCIENH